MRNIKYIIKRVIIGVLIAVSIMFIKQEIPHAATIYNIRQFGNSGYSGSSSQVLNSSVYYNNANVERDFQLQGLGTEVNTDVLYWQVLFCVNANNLTGTSWSNANDPQSFTGWGTRNSIVSRVTNIPCTIPNGYSGQVFQVTGVTATSQDGGGDITTSFRVSFNQNATYSLTYWGIQAVQYEPLYNTIDYTSAINSVSNAINSSTTTIINNQNTNTATTNNLINATNQLIEEDFTIVGADRDTREIEEWLDDFSSDTYGLTSIITAPLETIEDLTSSTCSPLTVPLPFVDSDLSLPCMTTIYRNTFGSAFTLYQTITTALIGYWVIVRMFAIVKGMKDPNDDKIEVVDL